MFYFYVTLLQQELEPYLHIQFLVQGAIVPLSMDLVPSCTDSPILFCSEQSCMEMEMR